MQRARRKEILQETDLVSIDKPNSNVTWYSHRKPTAPVYVAISWGQDKVSGRFGMPSAKGSRNVSYILNT